MENALKQVVFVNQVSEVLIVEKDFLLMED
jgi:hypothetical protein